MDQEQLKNLIAKGGPAALKQLIESGAIKVVGNENDFPKSVKTRVDYLEKLQEQHQTINKEFNRELRALEEKYRAKYEPLYAERAQVVTGEKEAPDATPEEGDPKGIPDFWATCLQNCPETQDAIQAEDAPILSHLTNITWEPLVEKDAEGGFRLTFTFSENEFFENTVLTKDYVMDDDDMLLHTKATEIKWKEGKNVTVKLVKKKTRKGKVTKEEKTDSFFNFFTSLSLPDEGGEDDEDVEMLQATMEEDYSRGDAIKSEIIPNAVGFFTGEAVEDMPFDFDEDDDEDEEGEDDEEADEDETQVKTKGVKKGGAGGAGAGAPNPEECKQQ